MIGCYDATPLQKCQKITVATAISGSETLPEITFRKIDFVTPRTGT